MLNRLRRAARARTRRAPRRSQETGPIVIVGAGFAGIGMAIRLKQAGVRDFVILESASRVGGTWRDNSYPGCACDVPSHLYSYSFEPNPRWSRHYAPQAEIWQYIERCVDKYGLAEHIRFETRVERAELDEAKRRWRVHTSRGQVLEARVLIAGCGGLSKPKTPDIAGLDGFRGKRVHSARWDHDYDFAGKRTAVIGTGASAIQIVPELARVSKRLAVFQRTPPWILPRSDRAISPRAQELYARYPAVQEAHRQLIYAELELRALGFVVDPRIMKGAEFAAKLFLQKSVPDPALRTRLTPSYAIGCKRVLLSDDYYPALQQGHVELVTDGIERVSERGIITKDGREHELDAIVLATGFQAAEAMAPFEVRGRGGVELSELWREGGEAYLGTSVRGFPNFYVLVGPNTFLAHSSMLIMMEAQMGYVMQALEALHEAELLDVRADVQARYNADLAQRLHKSVWAAGCQSWYLNRHGKNTTVWPGFTFEFRARLSRFEPADYEVVPAREAAQPAYESDTASPAPRGSITRS